MKRILLILFLLASSLAFAQGEANNWYFGQRAGIRFNGDGTVTPLPGGQISTTEGCSSMSDALGNLLFYTDGRSVWDRNHLRMPNANYNAGTGLLGDPSSTQSGIIVPKKGDPNIYYVFTVDEPHHQNAMAFPNQFTGTYFEPSGILGTIPTDDDGFNNGLNYSIIDLSVNGANGSVGDVTTRNVHLLTYDPANPDEAKYKCSEKITAVKTANGSGYWVVTHFLDKFYAFKVDAMGVSTTPVVTQIEPMVTQNGYRRNSIGYLKASPDGQKLAVAHLQRATVEGSETTNGAVYLYDFNDATGVVSNPVIVKNNVGPYGIEFSPEAKFLYVSYSQQSSVTGLQQYDLLAANIPASETTILASASQGALQLGPNGKIYHAVNGTQFLGVINAPEEAGTLCDFQQFGQQAATGTARTVLGLPPFITSLFSATIQTANTCLGQSTTFQLNVNKPFDTVSWNFGDGSAASTETTPSHTYAAAGTYTVVADVTRQGEVTQVSMDVTITAIPVANIAPAITLCDTGNDGTETFNLAVNNPAVLGAQNPALFDVKYYASQDDANNDTNALTAAAFNNATNPQMVFARVQNKINTKCFATSSFEVRVTNAPVLTTTSFATCDDAADGDDTNGRAIFNLDAATLAMVQNSTQFTTKYYPTFAKALSQNDALPVNFYNTTPNSQVVFARVTSNVLPDCFRIEPVTLIVNPLPPVVTGAALVQCDLAVSPDGLTQFSLSEADGQLTGGNANFTVTYYATTTEAQNNGSPLPDAYTNTANPQQIAAKVTNTQTGCSRILPLNLVVNANATTPITLQLCDEESSEDGITQFNLRDAGLETGTNVVIYYANADDALLEQNPVTPNFTNTVPNQQSVYARIENNNQCTTLQEIKLVVRKLPNIDTAGEGLVCLNTGAFITLDPGLNEVNPNFIFVWSTGATTRTIQVNQPGTYSVRVIDTRFPTLCEKTRIITVTASDVAVITGVDIVDLAENNTVTVHVQPGNNVNTTYLYSLDLPDGPYQESNYFENVTAGTHTVYVYDTQGCGVVHKDIAVLSIPKFFTPNHDGVNDTWNIIGVNSLFYSKSKIYIFDRFGKMLANVDPRGDGWTGIYNGHNLPATDYWFVLELDNGRVVKGHFSLMR